MTMCLKNWYVKIKDEVEQKKVQNKKNQERKKKKQNQASIVLAL